MMKNIRTLAHIRTPRMLNSFRACINMTGQSQILTDFGRIYLEEYRRLNRLQQINGKRVVARRIL